MSSSRGLNPCTRAAQLSVKSLSKKPLVNMAAVFFMLSCLTKITVSSLGLVAWEYFQKFYLENNSLRVLWN